MEESKEFSRICSDQNIQQWLKDVFQEDIPSFEETPEFIETLEKIMNENKRAEKDAKIMIKAEKNMKDLYNKKAEELQLVTEFIQLNSETRERVRSVALLAENMKLKEPSLTNFVLGMTEIEDKKAQLEEKRLISSHHLSVLSKKIKHVMMMNGKLSRSLKSLTEIVDKQKTHDIEITDDIRYFEAKTKQVEEKIGFLRSKLKETGYEKEVSHSDLVEQAQKLKELDEQRKTLENKLQAYHSLNPSFNQTLEEVLKKEKELVQLEKELQILLEGVETS